MTKDQLIAAIDRRLMQLRDRVDDCEALRERVAVLFREHGLDPELYMVER